MRKESLQRIIYGYIADVDYKSVSRESGITNPLQQRVIDADYKSVSHESGISNPLQHALHTPPLSPPLKGRGVAGA